ncbi:Vicianin hydrolase, putative [Theobroma cacao]|uniref:Vicianin hydrolase, putative n=1 Tax=Theobroma cacao TaxID=3641 RepID=A0A061DWI8_THECC|nr:Vicianin hydrolase, putative [Theobroma cacao]
MRRAPMCSGASFLFCLLVLFALILATCTHAAKPSYLRQFNRNSFPAGFLFGSGSAAYQVCSTAFVYAFRCEGAANEHGRGPSIWETFVREHPEKIADQSTGDVAVDFYHRYKEDIKLMKKFGFDSFRFFISWTRILPKGKISGGVNQQGVQFYNNLINELLANALEDEYGGFLSSKIVHDFEEYADFCFKTFGDRVKLWVTTNEPNGWSTNGYNSGSFAPGRCSSYVGNCSSGDSATEPYVVSDHLLLSHAAAVKLYKQKYQASQKGKIGITIVTNWYKPISNTAANRMATSRALDFFFGWFVRPITFGDYPKSMRSAVGSRLPKFSEAQSKMLKGSLDFLGVNYCTTNYVENAPSSNKVNLSYADDRRIKLTTEKKGVSIGLPTALSWLFIYPKGLRELLLYINENYNNPAIYITENGVADANNASLPIKDALKDNVRIRYLHGHLTYLLKAIKEGVDVKAYYVWTFLDDFEWDAGYTVRFGLTYIDFKNNLKRYLKYSAYWLKMFLLK